MNKILTVSQLNNYIKNVFEDELLLQNITVEGEVSEAKFSGGNTYITLKEGEYALSCVKFGSRFEYSVGDKIHVTGTMRFYPRGGRTSFVIAYASAVGKGDALIKLNALKAKLDQEGIFDNRKRLPRFIERLALITATEGAVIHDFLEVLNRNGCGYIDIDVYGVKVQGIGAEQTVSNALMLAAGRNYDALVIARGGGSEQDLSCFNTEMVARGVFGCPYPVISAIGHEVDYTLCDFASSLRAGTPSIAAELIVRNNEEFINRFYECLMALHKNAEALIAAMTVKTKKLSEDLMFGCERKTSELKGKMMSKLSKMYDINRDKALLMDNLFRGGIDKISRLSEEKLALCEHELKLATAILDKSSPLKILSDGYAKIIKSGKYLDSAADVIVGDNLKVVMSGGAFDAVVTNKE